MDDCHTGSNGGSLTETWSVLMQGAAAAAAAAAAGVNQYLGVPVKLVVNEAGFGDAGDLLESALIPVGTGRHNGSLADLANHQHLLAPDLM